MWIRRSSRTFPSRSETAASPSHQENAAWGYTAQSEPRWPAVAAIIAALLLYVTLPDKLTFGPRWILPALEAALIVPLVITAPQRRASEERWQRIASLVIIAVINLANVISLVFLLNLLVSGTRKTSHDLLYYSVQIWVTNLLVFALWYWELDRGGPSARLRTQRREPDFLFPQMINPGCAPSNWTPAFLDYFYVSFTNATAFSPTDTMPLTPWAKMLMAVQALASLLTVALVAARAVNILGS